ncbi:hypothetical protein [Nocardia salmonicida]|uniref:hypothetical protein n=1 Tax=Nocardia salmonicida TaxID=53431 RepID=UPI003409B0B8
MSGRKQIYVDEAAWNRLQADASKLAQVNRDLPGLIQRVRDETDRSIADSVATIDARHAQFEAALTELSDGSRQAEARAEQRLHETSRALLGELSKVREDSADGLRAQRERFERDLETERAARQSQYVELDRRVGQLQDDHTRAATLVAAHLSDLAVLRARVVELPHNQFCPGRLAECDREADAVRAEIDGGAPAAFLLDSARGLSREMSALRTQVVALDAQWQACRYVAERELVRLRAVISAHTTIDVGAAFQTKVEGEAPDVDFWSGGALVRLSMEVDALLGRVRDSENPLDTAELAAIAAEAVPKLDQDLDDIVGLAVSALRSSQLRANLAGVIAQALEDNYQYQVVDDADIGYVAGDARGTFMAKTVNSIGASEIIIEISPGTRADSAPTVEVHTFDGDVADEERQARIAAIEHRVHDLTGIDLRSETVATEPDPRRRAVAELVKQRTTDARQS